MNARLMEKKKILFVISTLNTGGAQRAFANMSMGFPEEYECDFLLNDTENITYPYKGNLISLGMRPERDKTKIWYQLKVLCKRCRMIKTLKKTGSYIACISGLTSANVANILTKNEKCKTIISIRTYTSKDKMKGIKGLINSVAIKYLYNNADFITTVSKSSKIDLVENYRINHNKIYTIYNGYSVGQIRALSEGKLIKGEEQWFELGRRTVVTMGRLAHEKGQWHLVRAMKMVCDYVPEVQLLILGTGEWEEKLRNLSEQCGIQDRIIFGGFVEEPYHILSKCDLFVLSSLYEGFPNAMVEAMCCGLPVIAADFDSGAREILAPGTDIMYKVQNRFEEAEYGILCKMMDGIYHDAREALSEAENSLADALIYILKNKKIYRKYKEQSQKRAEQFSMEKVICKWMHIVGGEKIDEDKYYNSCL